MNDLFFRRENYAEIITDIKRLLPSHWQELALYKDDIPLDPDFELYSRAAAAGHAVIVAARAATGELRGYAIYFTKKHHHYQNHQWAVSDIFWLHPDDRNIGNGRALFGCVEEELKKAGVDVIHTTLKVSHPAAKFLLESMGHTLVEYGLSKKLS